MRAAPRRRLLVAVLAFAAVVGVLSARALTRLNLPAAPKNGTEWVLSDFRDAVYYPERAFLDGKDPYDYETLQTYPVGNGFPVYSPITFLVHLPFGLLPYRTAELAYFVTTLALTVVLAWLALVSSEVAADAPRVLAVASVLLISRPGHQNLLLGQTTLPIAIGAYVAMRWAHQRPWLAAAGLVLSSIKPNWIAPLALLMLARREARPVLIGAALATLGALAGLVVLAATPGALAGVLTSARANFAGWNVSTIVLPASSWIRVDAWALFGRLVGSDLGLPAKIALSIGILGVSALALVRVARGTTPAARHVALAVTCLAVLLCVHHQSYDVLFLAAPLVGLALAPQALPPAAGPGTRAVLLTLLAVPFVNYAATDTSLTTFAVTGTAWIAVTSVNGAALLAAWLGYVILAFRPVLRGER
jgi:hypothetical protein